MSDSPSASRPAPPVVPPIEYQGVRYREEMGSYSYGGDQSGGYLVALDALTGKRLWMIKVYQLQHQDAAIDDIGIYFKSMRLLADRNSLEIENEAGARYLIDLEKRSVSVLFEPGGEADQSSGAPPPPPPPAPK